MKRNALPFITAFVTGIFFDAFSIHPLGGTSMFLLGFVFLIMLYQRKYEIYSYQFVMIISFMGIVLHVWIFAYPEKISLSLAGVVLSGVLFAIVKSPQPPLSRGR
jgi:cell shape-determining protein MreD